MTDYSDYDQMEYEDFKTWMDNQSKHAERYQAEKQNEATQKYQQDVFAKALDKVGIDPQTFQMLVNEDPQHAQEVFAQGVETYVDRVAKKPRDSRGRFVAQSQAPRPGVPQPPKRSEATQQRLDELKQKSREGHSTDEQILDVLETLFPGGF